MNIGKHTALVASTAIAIITILAGPAGAASADSPKTTHAGRPYAGDPVKEAALVSSENQRIYNLKAITDAARWQGIATTNPYIVNLGSTPTLVLVANAQPYTISGLESLIPAKFVGQPDGSYLLSDNIVVEAGAVLSLANPDGLTIRMTSSNKGFVSMVAFGGSLVFQGSAKKNVTIESWDPSVGTVDSNTTDGRAYVRVIGGSAKLNYASFNHLGFWSGGTGGVALTGTQLSASDAAKSSLPAKTQTPTPVGGKVHGAKVQTLQPTGTIGDVAAAIGASTGQYSYVTASVSHSHFDSNAYGLYVNGSQGVNITDSSVANSLVDGIVFHRFVTNSTITNTSSSDNAMDGFAMTRASTGVIIRGLTANNNGRDGVSLNGASLASGPNPAGTAVAVYGNNSLFDSTANNNGRNGITVSGGENIKLLRNTVNSNFMGIVLTRAASRVVATNNTVRNSTQHGISVLAAVTNSTIESNTVDGADIGIYLRDSTATVSKNTISNVHVHGVTFIGATLGSKVFANTVSGSGPTAVDTARGTGVTVGLNFSPLWTTTKPFLVILAGIFQPLTVLWIVLGLIVLISAISGIGRKYSGFRHPYADQVPLSTLTKGVVTPAELGLEERVTEDVTAELSGHHAIVTSSNYALATANSGAR